MKEGLHATLREKREIRRRTEEPRCGRGKGLISCPSLRAPYGLVSLMEDVERAPYVKPEPKAHPEPVKEPEPPKPPAEPQVIRRLATIKEMENSSGRHWMTLAVPAG